MRAEAKHHTFMYDWTSPTVHMMVADTDGQQQIRSRTATPDRVTAPPLTPCGL